MIDHLSLAVADLGRAKAFWDAVLAPLGYGRVMELDFAVAYGTALGAPGGVWLGERRPGDQRTTSGAGFHLAFVAPDRRAVDAFHAAALAAGAEDDGAPGLRPHYHPEYYGAFVIDPDGHKLEAVCHQPA